MAKRKFDPGDWARIKYGEYAGRCAKVSLLEKDGRYGVIPYNEKGELEGMITMNARSMDRIEPYSLSRGDLKKLARGEIFYGDLSGSIFPPFNVKAEKGHELDAGDIKAALLNINKEADCLDIFKEWFWVINNIFYADLDIKGRYREEYFSDTPETDDDIFSVCFSMLEKLYWGLEERVAEKEDYEKYLLKFERHITWDRNKNNRKVEKEAYFAVCEDLISRVDAYEQNKGLEKKQWIYSDSQKRHILQMYEDESSLEGATQEALEIYRKFAFDLALKGDQTALNIIAWGCYEGNAAFSADWKESEKYLLRLYNEHGDPYAANALGYIYFYGRVSGGVPEYEKAFKYFCFGALDGNDESLYKAADMLIGGLGVPKNIDMGLNIIADGYGSCMEHFCEGDYANKLADYALRMGDACRNDLVFGMGLRDAYKFYLEAEFAINKRMETGKMYGDEKVRENILRQIAAVKMKMGDAVTQKQVRTDFPIFINQLFDDRFPVKISINVPAGAKTGTLTATRYRFGQELVERGFFEGDSETAKLLTPQPVLIAYPEMSTAALKTEITYTMEKISVVSTREKVPYFLANSFRRNEKTNGLEFFLGNEMVAAIEAAWYIVKD